MGPRAVSQGFAELLLFEGAYKESVILYQKSIKRHQEIGRMQLIADCLAGLAMVAQKVGDY